MLKQPTETSWLCSLRGGVLGPREGVLKRLRGLWPRSGQKKVPNRTKGDATDSLVRNLEGLFYKLLDHKGIKSLMTFNL